MNRFEVLQVYHEIHHDDASVTPTQEMLGVPDNPGDQKEISQTVTELPDEICAAFGFSSYNRSQVTNNSDNQRCNDLRNGAGNEPFGYPDEYLIHPGQRIDIDRVIDIVEASLASLPSCVSIGLYIVSKNNDVTWNHKLVLKGNGKSSTSGRVNSSTNDA